MADTKKCSEFVHKGPNGIQRWEDRCGMRGEGPHQGGRSCAMVGAGWPPSHGRWGRGMSRSTPPLTTLSGARALSHFPGRNLSLSIARSLLRLPYGMINDFLESHPPRLARPRFQIKSSSSSFTSSSSSRVSFQLHPSSSPPPKASSSSSLHRPHTI
jgi:hypothetical protein